MVQATDGNSLHQQGAATHTMLTLQLPRLPSEQLSAGLEFGQGADLSGAPWDSFWGTHEHLEAGPFHLGGAAPAWVTLNQSSTSTEQGGGRTASTPPPAAATQDDTGWWSHISSDAPHAGTNEAHTLLDTYPPARHTTSPPGRQAGLFGNPTVQLPASAAHLGHDPGAHHAHQPRQPSPPWLLQPAPDSMSPPCEPQPGREPGASRFQSHGSLSFRPGHRHMSDPGLDSPFTPGSRSTPGGRSASSASAGGAAQRHPHARGQGHGAAGWHRSVGVGAASHAGGGIQAVDQMFTSPEAQSSRRPSTSMDLTEPYHSRSRSATLPACKPYAVGVGGRGSTLDAHTVHPSNHDPSSNPAHGYEESEVLSSSVVMFGYSPDPTLVYGQEATDKSTPFTSLASSLRAASVPHGGTRTTSSYSPEPSTHMLTTSYSHFQQQQNFSGHHTPSLSAPSGGGGGGGGWHPTHRAHSVAEVVRPAVTSFAPEPRDHARPLGSGLPLPARHRPMHQHSPANTHLAMHDAGYANSHPQGATDGGGFPAHHRGYSLGGGGEGVGGGARNAFGMHDPVLDSGVMQRGMGDGRSAHSSPMCGTWDRRYTLEPQSVDYDGITTMTGEEHPTMNTGKRQRENLPKPTVQLMKRWLLQHITHPYPSETEKGVISQATSLNINQINNWFINARVRIWKPILAGVWQVHGPRLAAQVQELGDEALLVKLHETGRSPAAQLSFIVSDEDSLVALEHAAHHAASAAKQKDGDQSYPGV
ncbi:MAG: hypothetical protein WDW36_006676 [Sanguina aurantia]